MFLLNLTFLCNLGLFARFKGLNVFSTLCILRIVNIIRYILSFWNVEFEIIFSCLYIFSCKYFMTFNSILFHFHDCSILKLIYNFQLVQFAVFIQLASSWKELKFATKFVLKSIYERKLNVAIFILRIQQRDGYVSFCRTKYNVSSPSETLFFSTLQFFTSKNKTFKNVPHQWSIIFCEQLIFKRKKYL